MHLKGLNGIRAIAAICVLLAHTNDFIVRYSIPALNINGGMAEYGVTMFFVLSGFLITYLLLNEKKATSSISIKKFYMRRILRIWPIYYLIILVTLLLFQYLPEIGAPLEKGESILLYSFFAANIAYGLNLTFTTLTPLWSVGVEEQFYLFWPLLVRKSKNILTALIGVIVVYTLAKFLLRYFENGIWYKIIWMLRIDCMAIGGIGAYLLINKKKGINFFFYPAVEIVTWLVIFYSIIRGPIHVLTFIDHDLYAIVFLSAILNVSSNPRKIINLENKWMDFIGRISYGIYVYHMLVICVLTHFLKSYVSTTPASYLLIFFLTISITLLLAFLSYEFFEKKFIGMKEKFSVIKSRNSAYFS